MPEKRKYAVGWVTAVKWPYREAMASARIRCLDIIQYLKSQNVRTSIYNPFRRYEIVVFQKAFSEKYYELAKRLANAGSKIVLDVNVNYFTKIGETPYVSEKQIEDLRRFLDLADTVLVSSLYLKSVAENYHPSVFYIPEHISLNPTGSYPPKKISNPAKLLYCGYANKADEILLIEDVLKELSKVHQFEFLVVCDQYPSLKLPIKTSFIKYQYKNIADILRQGDIKVAPRELDNSYNLGHAFTKIGYPMSVGVPVVASPVPSYQGSPALLCSSTQEWYRNIKTLLDSQEKYYGISESGINYVRENFLMRQVGDLYLKFFDGLALS